MSIYDEVCSTQLFWVKKDFKKGSKFYNKQILTGFNSVFELSLEIETSKTFVENKDSSTVQRLRYSDIYCNKIDQTILFSEALKFRDDISSMCRYISRVIRWCLIWNSKFIE